MIAVFLANGFEEIEALATVDILRRAGLQVVTVGVDTKTPVGAHDMQITADLCENDLDFDAMTGVVLPGGMPGTSNLERSDVVQKAVAHAMKSNLPVGAICAAPSILGHAGYLDGKQATCYPGFEQDLTGAMLADGVVTDENVTTACGAGVAVDFALELVRVLVSDAKAQEIRRAIQCR